MVTFKVLRGPALGSILVSLIRDSKMNQTRMLIKAYLWWSWLKAWFKCAPRWSAQLGDWPARTAPPTESTSSGTAAARLGSARVSLWKKELHSFVNRRMTKRTTPIFFRAMLEMSDTHSLKFLRGSTKRTSRWVSAGFVDYWVANSVPMVLLEVTGAVSFCCFYLYCEYLGSSPALAAQSV